MFTGICKLNVDEKFVNLECAIAVNFVHKFGNFDGKFVNFDMKFTHFEFRLANLSKFDFQNQKIVSKSVLFHSFIKVAL